MQNRHVAFATIARKIIHSVTVISYLFTSLSPTFSCASQSVTLTEELPVYGPERAPQAGQGGAGAFPGTGHPLGSQVQDDQDRLVQHDHHVPELVRVDLFRRSSNQQGNDQGNADGKAQEDIFFQPANGQTPCNLSAIVRSLMSIPVGMALIDRGGKSVALRLQVTNGVTLTYDFEKQNFTIQAKNTGQRPINLEVTGAEQLYIEGGHFSRIAHGATRIFLRGQTQVDVVENVSDQATEQILFQNHGTFQGQLLGTYQNLHIGRNHRFITNGLMAPHMNIHVDARGIFENRGNLMARHMENSGQALMNGPHSVLERLDNGGVYSIGSGVNLARHFEPSFKGQNGRIINATNEELRIGEMAEFFVDNDLEKLLVVQPHQFFLERFVRYLIAQEKLTTDLNVQDYEKWRIKNILLGAYIYINFHVFHREICEYIRKDYYNYGEGPRDRGRYIYKNEISLCDVIQFEDLRGFNDEKYIDCYKGLNSDELMEMLTDPWDKICASDKIHKLKYRNHYHPKPGSVFYRFWKSRDCCIAENMSVQCEKFGLYGGFEMPEVLSYIKQEYHRIKPQIEQIARAYAANFDPQDRPVFYVGGTTGFGQVETGGATVMESGPLNNMQAKGSLALSPRRPILNLQELVGIRMDGCLRAHILDLVQKDDVKLPFIKHLFLEGRSFDLFANFQLPSLTVRVSDCFRVGLDNDHLAALELTESDLDVICGTFDGRYGQLKGPGSFFLKTLIGDILLGEHKWLNGGTQPAVDREGRPLASRNGHKNTRQNYAVPNGSSMEFGRRCLLESVKDIIRRGHRAQIREDVGFISFGSYTSEQSILIGLKNGTIQSEVIRLDRLPPLHVDLGYYSSYYPNVYTVVLRSEADMTVFVGDLNLINKKLSINASDLEVGGNIQLNGIKKEQRELNVYLETQRYGDGNCRDGLGGWPVCSKLTVGKKIMIPNGDDVSLPETVSANQLIAVSNILQQKSLSAQKFRNVSLSCDMEVASLLGARSVHLGMPGITRSSDGIFENPIPGGFGFRPNLANLLVINGAGLNLWELRNPLERMDMPFVVMKLMIAQFGRAYIIDPDTGVSYAGLEMTSHLIENGRVFARKFLNTHRRLPTLEDITTQSKAMMYFDAQDGELKTHIFWPSNTGSPLKLGGSDFHHFNVMSRQLRLEGSQWHFTADSQALTDRSELTSTVERRGTGDGYDEYLAGRAGFVTQVGKLRLISRECTYTQGALLDAGESGEIHVSTPVFWDEALPLYHEHQTKTKKHGKKNTETASGKTHVSSTFAGNLVHVEASERAHLQAPDIQANRMEIAGQDGAELKITAAVDQRHTSTIKQSGRLLQSVRPEESHHTRVNAVNVAPHTQLTITGFDRLFVEHRADQALAPQLQEIIDQHPNAQVVRLQDTNEYIKHKTVHTLNPKFRMIVSAAVALALTLSGMPGALAGQMGLTGLGLTAGTAGLTQVMQHTLVTTLESRGDVGKALKGLGEERFLKSLTVNMGSAGLFGKLRAALDMPNLSEISAPELMERLNDAALRTAVTSTLRIIVQGESVRNVAQQGLQGVAGDVLQGKLAQLLGQYFKDPAFAGDPMAYMARIGSHGILGYGSGLIRSNDGLSGAVGAMSAEITADLLLEMTGHPEGFDPSNKQDREARDKALAVTEFVTQCLAVAMDLDPFECANSGQIAARENALLKNLFLNPDEDKKADEAAEETTVGQFARQVDKKIDMFFDKVAGSEITPQQIADYQQGLDAFVALRQMAEMDRLLRNLTPQEQALTRWYATHEYSRIEDQVNPGLGRQAWHLVAPIIAEVTGNTLDVAELAAMAAGVPGGHVRAARWAADDALMFAGVMGLATGAAKKVATRAAKASASNTNLFAQAVQASRLETQAITKLTAKVTQLDARAVSKEAATKARAISRGESYTPTPAAPSQIPGLDLGGVQVKKQLLQGEGKVGSYGDLGKTAYPGDNVSAHHMPASRFMESHGVKRTDGIAMNVEELTPGTGGRHRKTRTYGRPAKLDETPREALARDVKDARKIYREDGLYKPVIHDGLKEVIEKNKNKFPDIFGGKDGKKK